MLAALHFHHLVANTLILTHADLSICGDCVNLSFCDTNSTCVAADPKPPGSLTLALSSTRCSLHRRKKVLSKQKVVKLYTKNKDISYTVILRMKYTSESSIITKFNHILRHYNWGGKVFRGKEKKLHV